MDKRNLPVGDGTLALVLRLAVISLVAGIALSAVGINPGNLLSSLNVVARHIYDLGFSSIEWIAQYMLLGAMVVVPIWALARVLGGAKARRD